MRIILAAAALVLGGGAFAQSLPELGKASEITTGKLPDGISYYLISNPATPGFADFALRQLLVIVADDLHGNAFQGEADGADLDRTVHGIESGCGAAFRRAVAFRDRKAVFG